MPLYTYTCVNCDTESEKITAIATRDEQFCETCGYRLNRAIDRPGAVWAPTSTGGGLAV